MIDTQVSLAVQGKIERTFLVLLDGARCDVMRHLIDHGQLPNIARYLAGDPESMSYAVTAFPSVTGPAYLPFLTGFFPGHVNVPGIRWFDRTCYAARNQPALRTCRSYAGHQADLLNADIGCRAATLFEILTPSVSVSMFNRGAAPLSRWQTFRLKLAMVQGHILGAYLAGDWLSCEIALRSADLPSKFVFLPLLSIDGLSHHYGPFSMETIEAYHQADRMVGHLVDKLRQNGDCERTLLILTSDHGMTTTMHHLDLAGFIGRRGYQVLSFPRVLFRDRQRIDAVVMESGNSMAHLYIRGEQDQWNKKSTWESLQRWDSSLVSDLLAQPAVDLLCLRCDDGTIRILSRRGTATLQAAHGVIQYTVTGCDPLGYQPMPHVMTHAESLVLTASTSYPDALVQIASILASQRSGDIVVSATPGYDLRERFEWPEHRGSHGSLHREHMLIPLMANLPISRAIIRSADLFPTILRMMNCPSVQVAYCDGADALVGELEISARDATALSQPFAERSFGGLWCKS